MADKRIKDLTEITNIDDANHRYVAVDGDGNGSSSNSTDRINIQKLTDAIKALLSAINATAIADGSVSNEEFQRLNGVTSEIQAQLDNKIGKMQANGGKAVISKSDGTIEETQITSEELNYLDGVTSGIQAQLDNKIGKMQANGGKAVISKSDGTIEETQITSEELNYLDGVTSGIQAQLNGKADNNHSHTEDDITNLDKYTQAEVNSLISKHKMAIPGDEGGKLVGDKVTAIGQSSPLSGTFTINVNVPSGVMILGCVLRVDSDLNRNWDAKYDDGGTFTQVIATDQNKAQNTKVKKFYDSKSDSNITTNEVDIKITSHDGNPFDNNGKIRATVFYLNLINMASIGA